MQARGPLMIEHRLIERMIRVIQTALELVERTREIDPLFVDTAVDFIHTYADRTHHGKEEDIMFRDLEKRNLSDADRRIMNELIEEHGFGRTTTKALIEANVSYRNGDRQALDTIKSCLRSFVEFYPRHIEKEDEIFFPAVRRYFTEEEDQAMLAEFREFDQKMIHEKYISLVQALEK